MKFLYHSCLPDVILLTTDFSLCLNSLCEDFPFLTYLQTCSYHALLARQLAIALFSMLARWEVKPWKGLAPAFFFSFSNYSNESRADTSLSRKTG
jgi:hypothetical protein